MKRLVKLSILLVSLFIGINFVDAKRSCEDIVLYSDSNFWAKAGINMYYGGITYNYSLFNLKNSTGEVFSSYCRNAGIAATYNNTTPKFVCEEVVFDTSISNEHKKTYDAGIVGILKSGYNTKKIPATDDEKINYIATNVALRTYEMLWPQENTNGKNTRSMYKANMYYANMWLDDSTIKNLLNEVSGTIPNKYSSPLVTTWSINNSIIRDKAKALVIEGLQAAKKYKDNGAASLKWSDPKKSTSASTIGDDGETNYKTAITYKFTAEKFQSSGAYINIEFSCPNCSNYGIDYNIYIIDKNNRERNVRKTIPTNLMSYLSGGAGTFSIKIEFTGSTATYNCEQIPYVLNVKYYDESISTEAYTVYAENCKSGSCQHFYLLYADDVAQEDQIKSNIELCSYDCLELEKMCNEGDRSACARFASQFDSDCGSCTTYVSNAKCTYDESNVDILEGYNPSGDVCEEPETSELDVLKCVINKTDEAGNSYQATDLVSNKYCSVWCKEDYHMELPGNKEVKSGRYFSLSASIKGAKTCYTSKIDKTAFENDYETARAEMLEAYNNLKFYESVLNVINHRTWLNEYDNPQIGASHGRHGCGENGCACYGRKAPDYYNYEYIWYFNGYDVDGSSLSSTSKIKLGSNTRCTRSGGHIKCTYTSLGTSSCPMSHSTCSSTNGTDINDVYTGVSAKITSYKNTIKSRLNKMSTLLNVYNSCSNWTMDYKFDPDIHFWYEESYMDNVRTDLLDTIGTPTKSGVTVQRCSTDTNSSYDSCATGWTSSSLIESVPKFLCYESGGSYACDFRNINVAQTIRMKESISVEGDYRTPTQFYNIYPTGAIVVAGESANIKNGTVLKNSLPVGLGTRQGSYNYTLVISNLGEYYNNDKLGRIWGADDSVVSIALDKTENTCYKNSAMQSELNLEDAYFENGVYTCAYIVNSDSSCRKVETACRNGDSDACDVFYQKYGGDCSAGGNLCPDKCPVECDKDGCSIPNCTKDNCPIVCESCIYTNNKVNVNYRPITSDNINPNDRELGNNWKWNDTIETELELKAYATTKEIEEAGDSIYDINYESSADEGYSMTVTLDSTMISRIRQYNDDHEEEGYTNNTLDCYDHTSEDGTVYENVYCYSTFIDELLTDDSTKGNIKITGGERYLTDGDRRTKTQLSGYWTTWSLGTGSNWDVTTIHELAVNVGPSWK